MTTPSHPDETAAVALRRLLDADDDMPARVLADWAQALADLATMPLQLAPHDDAWRGHRDAAARMARHVQHLRSVVDDHAAAIRDLHQGDYLWVLTVIGRTPGTLWRGPAQVAEVVPTQVSDPWSGTTHTLDRVRLVHGQAQTWVWADWIDARVDPPTERDRALGGALASVPAPVWMQAQARHTAARAVLSAVLGREVVAVHAAGGDGRLPPGSSGSLEDASDAWDVQHLVVVGVGALMVATDHLAERGQSATAIAATEHSLGGVWASIDQMLEERGRFPSRIRAMRDATRILQESAVDAAIDALAALLAETATVRAAELDAVLAPVREVAPGLRERLWGP
jgi:hypothetical protein